MKRDSEDAIRSGTTHWGRLDSREFRLMNSFIRRIVQKYFEFRFFKKVARTYPINLTGKVVMDAGCGSGYGAKLIVDEFRPSRVIAFDLMPEMITLALKRDLGIDFFVGDMTDIDVPDGTCDAVFIFGVLHHIKNWRVAVSEVIRVLKPGGFILVEEPRYGFTWQEFEEEFSTSGLALLASTVFFRGFIHAYVWRKQGVGSDISEG